MFPSLQHSREPIVCLAHALPVHPPDRGGDDYRAQHEEPAAAVEMRLPFEFQRCFGSIARTAHIERKHAEMITARRNIGIRRHPMARRFGPVGIEAFQPVAETDSLLRPQADGAILDLPFPLAWG